MESIINWKLASHPMNWAILFLMVFFALFAAHLIVSWTQAPKPNTPTGVNSGGY